MSSAPSYQSVSVRDYLHGEQTAKRKHEYVDGIVYAMVGASNVHHRVSTNATVALGGQLRGKRCQAFNSDTKVRIRLPRGTRFYYPDALVVCQPNPPSDTFQEAPIVIVEVVSPSTRRTDENEKCEAYLSIDSLCVYILIQSSAPATLVYRRGDRGFERQRYVGLDAVIPLPEIECELRLADLYENVEFPPATPDDQGDE